jgi:Ca2+-binding EF-hand superfamily protein
MRRIARAWWVFGFAAILGAASFGLTHHAEAAPRSVLKALDTDNDGTVDLAEAKAAASKLFDTLDRDHDGTLDRRELRDRMVSKEFGAADGDHDGTLDKDEYLAFVEKSFKAADRDNDGTLDAKELSAARGRGLLRLLSGVPVK